MSVAGRRESQDKEKGTSNLDVPFPVSVYYVEFRIPVGS